MPVQLPDDELQEQVERLRLLSQRVRERRNLWASWDMEMKAIQQERAWRRGQRVHRAQPLPDPPKQN